ncbi:MAG TPA: aldo/keto reductase [Opitutaceae bacterium]|jgi:aryl-alcohol dehydrogenase-like predicted oxidoreductase|nr:aldo/keto reductase [Opitutaceae bacterium]
MRTAAFPFLHEQVSRLGFGAFGLGGVFGAFDENEAIRSLHACWACGANFVDTARHYGSSEAIVGAALKSWGGAKPFVATKAAAIGPPLQWAIPPPVEVCFPRGHITREAEISLRVLGLETLDLFQMHLYWPNWGVEGYWLDELEALVAAGKARSIGVSLPDQRHDVGLPLVLSGRIHSVQTVLNIFDPLALDCLVPLCARHGVAVLARCVLDEGGLAGTLRPDTMFAEGDYRARYFDCGPREIYLERVDALREHVPAHAGTLAALALKFVLHDPGVTTALVSMHVRRFAEENLRAMAETPLSDDMFAHLRRRHRWVRNFYGPKVL